jgi:C-terminal processing protease CtpA/Prc
VSDGQILRLMPGIGLSLTPSKPHKVVQALLKDASGKDISAQVQVDDVLVAIDGKPLDEVIVERTESIVFCVRRKNGTFASTWSS